MREYSAISVSAADADSLAAKLTEQSRQGWELVDIVRTDDRVVAYLDREGSGGSPTPPQGSPAAAVSGAASGSVPPGGYAAVDTTVAGVDNQGNAWGVEQTTVTPTTPPSQNDGGWGAAATGAGAGAIGAAATTVGSTADSAKDAAKDAGANAAHSVGEAHDTHGAHVAHGSSTPSGGSDSSSGASSASTSGDSSGSGLAPAGWYGDPAGRFDLRYWDGSQWTEHVARGGQQDTDPPVRGDS